MSESITDREFLRNEAKNEAMKPAATSNQAPAKFSAADQDIKQGQMTVARAVSKTFAKRIANALNRYTPDRRGQ